MIDHASRRDLPQILAIYNEVIRNSTAVFSDEEFTPSRGETWFDAKMERGFPLIVARDASGIAGFGTFGEFRAWPGYRHSVEHSVHVRADCRGQGIGRALVLELLARAAGLGKHVMIAGIDADNAVSIGLHRSLGFTGVGHFHEVAFKFGRWLDLVFMQCILPPTVDSPLKE
jgi:L-amino acid N-acyltransferase YncA